MAKVLVVDDKEMMRDSVATILGLARVADLSTTPREIRRRGGRAGYGMRLLHARQRLRRVQAPYG